MFALFEDAGKFLAGRVMSEAESSMQIELDSGKRVKVKSANVLLKFEQPQPAQLLAQAEPLAAEIDLDLAWEFAVDLPAQSSCATGVLTGSYNDIYELDAEFLGEGEVAWTIARNGNEVASDTSTYSCGPYDPVW